MSKGCVAVARCYHHRQRQGPDFTKLSARAVPLKRAQSKMNRQMQMRKDEFRTDDEKDAWQQGYIASIEILTDLHQDLPENLHGALGGALLRTRQDAVDNRPTTTGSAPASRITSTSTRSWPPNEKPGFWPGELKTFRT